MASRSLATGENIRSDERTPLLTGQRDNGGVQQEDVDPDNAEGLQAASEAIREALPKSIVLPSIVAVFSSLFIAAIDSTLVIALVGPISSQFAAADRVFWISSAYMLTMCAFAPIWGRTSDVLGRKLCLICAVCTFGIGTLLCTAAPSMNALIIARGIQGIGAAGVQPSTAIVINDLIPLRSRGLYQATAQLVFSMGYALGGPVGGLINDRFGWRFGFTIQLPFIVIALILLSTFLKLPNFPKSTQQRKRIQEMEGKALHSILWARCDPIGAVLLLTSVVTALLSLSTVSEYDLDWSDARVVGGLVASAAFFATFLFVETRVAQEPLVPLRLMKQQSLASIWIVYLLMSVGVAFLFYLPFYFLVVLGQSSTEVGLHYVQVSASTLAGSFFSGFMLKKTGKFRVLLIILSIITLATPAYLATWTNTHKPSIFGQNVVLVPASFAGAAINTVVMVVLMPLAGQQDVANAVGLAYFFRAFGTIAGTSVLGSVIQKVLKVELDKRITGKHAHHTINLIRKDISLIPTLSHKYRQAAVESYSIALQTFHLIILGIMIAVVPFIMLIQERNLGGTATKQSGNAHASPENAHGTGAHAHASGDTADQQEHA